MADNDRGSLGENEMMINLNKKDTELVKDAVQSYYMISHHALEHYEKRENRDRVICIIDDLEAFAKRFGFELE